jgi:hypothetical protein
VQGGCERGVWRQGSRLLLLFSFLISPFCDVSRLWGWSNPVANQKNYRTSIKSQKESHSHAPK